MEASAEDEILLLVSRGNWEEILDKCEANRFLPWFWPDVETLRFIEKWAIAQRSNTLISVGCGSGLFEWLVQESTGLQVVGIEMDGTWWNSKYSPKTFIPLILVEDSRKGRLDMRTDNSVLLFCYFNNLNAFLDYLNNFRGSCFLVIGPGPGRGAYSIPDPFNLPKEIKNSWRLVDNREIQNSKNFIAAYTRT